jgi:hypothetical protein
MDKYILDHWITGACVVFFSTTVYLIIKLASFGLLFSAWP